MTESEHIWRLIRDKFSNHAHMCRVENMAGTGMADIEACRQGVSVWIEMKIGQNAKWRLNFRRTQPPVLRRRLNAGGRVWILARHKDTMRLLDAKEVLSERIYHGDHAGPHCYMETDCIRSAFTTHKPFDYAGLERVIFTPRPNV